MTLSPHATAGIQFPCPTCGAEPGELCENDRGERRQTTHRERKPKAEQD